LGAHSFGGKGIWFMQTMSGRVLKSGFAPLYTLYFAEEAKPDYLTLFPDLFAGTRFFCL